MQSLTFSLNISSQEYQRYYQGVGNRVVTVADDGRSVEFPASRLTRFVSHEGVHGHFEIIFDAANKFICLQRL